MWFKRSHPPVKVQEPQESPYEEIQSNLSASDFMWNLKSHKVDGLKNVDNAVITAAAVQAIRNDQRTVIDLLKAQQKELALINIFLRQVFGDPHGNG